MEKTPVEPVVPQSTAEINLLDADLTLNDYLWDYVDGEPLQNNRESMGQIPANTPMSDAMAKDLKKRGFTFVGSTICYAFMQAAGLVNDHLVDCYRHIELAPVLPGSKSG